MVEGRLAPLDARDLAFWFIERELGLSHAQLTSPSRAARLVEGRALFVRIVKATGPEDLSYPTIGRWLGNRDHTTIQHLFKVKAPQLAQHDADFALLCERFAERHHELLETFHGHSRH